MDLQEAIRTLERKLASLDSERAAILFELDKARKAMANEPRPLPELMGRPTRNEPPTTSADKVKLFLGLFRCREDLFPKRWENRKTGKQGYAPVCSNEWREPLCKKPKIKCSECTHQAFLPLNEIAVESHLKGTSTIGTYAIRKDAPYRKDGLEKILYQQCGPIRHEIKSIDGGILYKEVTIQETGFRTPTEFGDRPPYHIVIEALTTDLVRNQKVAVAVIKAIGDGKFPLLISDRKEHLDLLAAEVKKREEANTTGTFEIVRLDGDLSTKQRRHALERVAEIRGQGKTILLMATGSLIGEGFDLPELDTLILATPMSFEGRMVQYAGRIHRLVEGKKNVQILDFVDSFNPMLLNMYRNRLKAYRKMGYLINRPSNIMTGLAGAFSATPLTAP